MTIDSHTGQIRWTPYDYGTFPVTVRVTDVLGQSATQSYSVTVNLEAAAQPPVIVTQPVTSAIEGVTYTQQIVARDPQGQTIAYSLAGGGAGMTIDPQSGIIPWMPSFGSARSPSASWRATPPASSPRSPTR